MAALLSFAGCLEAPAVLQGGRGSTVSNQDDQSRWLYNDGKKCTHLLNGACCLRTGSGQLCFDVITSMQDPYVWKAMRQPAVKTVIAHPLQSGAHLEISARTMMTGLLTPQLADLNNASTKGMKKVSLSS